MKLINLFYKNSYKKLIATFLPIDSTLLMAKSTVKLSNAIPKQNLGHPANNANKQSKNWACVTKKQQLNRIGFINRGVLFLNLITNYFHST